MASKAVPAEVAVAEAKAEEEVTAPAGAPGADDGDSKNETAEEAAPAVEATAFQSTSFKEESNRIADLHEPEKKALEELKQLIKAALVNNEFSPPPTPPSAGNNPDETKNEGKPESAAKEVKSDDPAQEETTAVESSAAAPETPATGDMKVEVVDEDGAKTVVAIEETVVAVNQPVETENEKEPVPEAAEKVLIWGVPLLCDEKSNTVLLKFLRARDFKVKDSLAMIKNAVIWRKQFGIDSLLADDLAIPDLEKVVFYHGHDKEAHPVCYNVFGEFQDQDLYSKAFGDEEKREKFLRWRILFLEKGIRQQLDFKPGGISSMVQITDLKNVPGPGKKELRQATKKALALLQDNYPEFVAKQIFINVPWWYLAYNVVMSPFFSQRTKSKFVFAGPSKSAETLFKYIAPEQVPVQYGGLSKENDPDFTISDPVDEIIIKPSSKHIIELPAIEPCNLVWELRVLAWEVSYGAEFIPSAEGGYTVIVQKVRKFSSSDEPYVKNNFKVGEPGKIVLTFDNATTKKKKLLYRSKSKASTEST
ncbi:Patellin-3 [Apostasia shenzhenica]|uniref:Patellin-3 n=1 Tax=Apostasia shenzhenica TaxID=1088818 RepID=A0A2I0A868_9ASPA|nr:Patellin-3 [Apostasia shenzhenica]